MSTAEKQQIVTQILQAIGEDPAREGLRDTPRRVVRAWDTLFQGYRQDVAGLGVTFDEGYDQMVVLRGCEFFSFCEHHILPFYGTVSVGYVSEKRVIGISKLARIVEVFARRLQIQERLTQQIADTLMQLVKPKGVAVVVDGLHMCMSMRGVSKQRARMTTSAMRGVFLANAAARNEMLSLLRTRTEHE